MFFAEDFVGDRLRAVISSSLNSIVGIVRGGGTFNLE